MEQLPHVADRLLQRCRATGSVACVGLDPRPELVPPAIAEAARAVHHDPRQAVAAAFLDCNRRIIDAVAPHCAVVKPQVACYEAYGWSGMQALEATIAYAQERELPVIVDGKRNDIGSTATHYQQAWLGRAPGLDGEPVTAPQADWLTVNAYLGSDGVAPLLADGDRHGLFILVKTSNPSSGELQDRSLADGGSVAEAMARLVAGWGTERRGASGLSAIGAVVGATYPEQARQLRTLMPDSWFLVPGYGAQGGSAADALAGRRADGTGVVVNSSRAIYGAWRDSDANIGEAARDALQRMNEDLASV